MKMDKKTLAGRDARSPINNLGWYSRGYLPHFDGGEINQFVTLHLADALPKKVVRSWRIELENEDESIAKLELQRKIEKYIDRGFGKCYLNRESIAQKVQESLLYFHNERYKMISWVIMPNHIHFLFRPFKNYELKDLMHSIKSYSAQKCNKFLERKGTFWQADYFDRFIRDYEHYQNVLRYIRNNPVKVKLCQKPEDWKFSSFYTRTADIPVRKNEITDG